MGLRGSRRLRRKVEHVRDNLGDNVTDAAEDGASETANEMKRLVVARDNVWRTNLYRSIDARSVPSTHHSTIQVVADVPYAAYVEFGTGKRQAASTPLRFRFNSPSLTPSLVRDITDWVFTKPGFYGARTEATAWAIATTIAKEGTFAHPYMRPAWFKTKPLLLGNVRKAARNTLRRA